MNDYNRLLEASMRAFESAVMDQVELSSLPAARCLHNAMDRRGVFPLRSRRSETTGNQSATLSALVQY